MGLNYLKEKLEDYKESLEKYRVESLELSNFFRDIGFKVISENSRGNK